MKILLQSQLIQKIDEKANKECPDMALLYSSTYIRQLNHHINGSCKLTNNEIAEKIDYLAGCLTISLDNPLQKMEFLRVRLCEGDNFQNVRDLSYIKNTKNDFPNAGRLNKKGQALFYASVTVKKDDTALRVVLSESRAKDLDHLNALCSHQKIDSDLCLRIIGIWDYVRRNERPYYLSEKVFEYYVATRNYMVNKFDPKLLAAYDLTDRFFADILSRKGNENLYQVTSELGAFFMDGKVDGVLYSSVEAKGEPVVALAPSAVDEKIEHQFVCDISVEKHYGYEFFSHKNSARTSSIDSETGKLNW